MATSVSFPEFESHPEFRIAELVQPDGSAIVFDRETLRIGVSEICEIRLEQGPSLHSVIHNQAGVVWIEADTEAAELLVNGRICRRMALRNGDVINAGGLQMTLHFRAVVMPTENPGAIEDDVAMEDVTQMSAEELCDRILEEQAEIDRFEASNREGWKNLMAAIQSVHEAEQVKVSLPAPEPSDENEADCERLFDQIHEMSEMMNGRTAELDDCEAELVAATALLHETQDRVTQRIEELLEQFKDASHSTEMRASA